MLQNFSFDHKHIYSMDLASMLAQHLPSFQFSFLFVIFDVLCWIKFARDGAILLPQIKHFKAQVQSCCTIYCWTVCCWWFSGFTSSFSGFKCRCHVLDLSFGLKRRCQFRRCCRQHRNNNRDWKAYKLLKNAINFVPYVITMEDFFRHVVLQFRISFSRIEKYGFDDQSKSPFLLPFLLIIIYCLLPRHQFKMIFQAITFSID